MKKRIISLLTITTVLSLVSSNVFAIDKDIVDSSENKITIEDATRNYYSTMETIYANEVSTKYLVTEYDKSFYLEFLNSGNVLIDNIEYQEEDFQKMILAQDDDLNKNLQTGTLKNASVNEYTILDYKDGYKGKVNTVDYSEINKELKAKETVNHAECTTSKLRCTACGQYSPNSPPTSGYHSFTVDFVKRGKLSSFTVKMTSSAIGKFASLFCKGVLAKAKPVMSKLVGWVAKKIINEVCNGDYALRQTWHNVCPRATREQRKYYVVDKQNKHRYVDIVDDYYYYSSNPY